MIPVFFKKPLPFSIFSFSHWDKGGKERLTIIAKGLFLIDGKGRLMVLRQKPDIAFQDIFNGKINITSLKSESDLAPFKPKTDLTFAAIARSPEGKELESWPVRFDVNQNFSYGFHVFGARQFEPVQKGDVRRWRLSDVKPIKELPLRYEYAYGGSAHKSETEIDCFAYNPVGRGFTTDYLLNETETPILVPQIGAIAELLNYKLGQLITVHGCGPIAKSWLPRLALAGTFDEAWLHERHPLMPTDFNDGYWNAAPLPLQISPYLQGDEIIGVRGLFHKPQAYSFQLPGAGLGAHIRRVGKNGIDDVPLNLDTVHCDISSSNKEDHRITLVWRLTLDAPDTIDEVVLHLRGLTSGEMTSYKKNDEQIRKENEEARQELIKEKEQRDQLLKKAGLTAVELNNSLAATDLIEIEGAIPSVLFFSPETGIPVVVDKEQKQPVHVGKAGFIYRDKNPSSPEHEPLNVHKQNYTVKMDQVVTIYVRLLGEKVDVWRPVNAVSLGEDIYYIGLHQPPHSDETWEFTPNNNVRCKWHRFSNKDYLVAVEPDKTHW